MTRATTEMTTAAGRNVEWVAAGGGVVKVPELPRYIRYETNASRAPSVSTPCHVFEAVVVLELLHGAMLGGVHHAALPVVLHRVLQLPRALRGLVLVPRHCTRDCDF